jgi:hypothetical protein
MSDAPRVTIEQIESKIVSTHYFTALDGVLTGAPVDNASADALSLDAIKQMWPLECYLLSERLYETR